MYKDLRDFIKQVDEIGALRRVNGANPKFELGGITEVAALTAEEARAIADKWGGVLRGDAARAAKVVRPQARRGK